MIPADPDAVIKARQRIERYARQTPIVTASLPTSQGPCPADLKLEFVQVSGSFKARGMFNAVLHAAERGRLPESGVIIASGGNAGLAAAVAAQAAGCPARVVVPASAPTAKIGRLQHAGAEVTVIEGDHRASNAIADDLASTTGALRLHAYDQDDVVCGAGTIALEILEQRPAVRSIVVAVGGGGLVAGVCRALSRPDVRVVAVEPSGAPTLHRALEAGRPVDVPVNTIASDSLGAVRIGELAFRACTERPVTSVLVSDEEILAAQRWLWNELRLLVEHSAAAVVAAVTSGAYQPEPAERPVLVLCGANVSDPSFS